MRVSKKYYHNKLVRDKIPRIIESNGEIYKTRKMRQGDYKRLLRKKLLEEAKEAVGATDKDELISELGDVMEVIRAIAKSENINVQQIEERRQAKENSLGTFKDKIFLVWSSRPKGTGAK